MPIQTVERELPLIDCKYLSKPGRYIRIFNIQFEMRNSPVEDYYYMVFICFVIYILIFFNFQLWQGNMIALFLLSTLFSSCVCILHECNRLEEEYMMNMKKAKMIFMDCQGNKDILNKNEQYYIYQASRELENQWYLELKKENHDA